MGVARKTKSVKTVLEVFEEAKSAISVVKLVELLRQEMNKTTVYRILDRLEDNGTLHSFLGEDGLKWYATCNNGCSSSHHLDEHPHFQCQDCGKTECLPIQLSIPNIPNYKVNSANILLLGLCKNCHTSLSSNA